MRNRTSLAMIELVLMFFVFALATVWCLKGFVWADGQSEDQYQYEMAMLQTQNAAEITKSCGGDFYKAAEISQGQVNQEGESWTLGFDENWEKTELDPVYTLQVVKEKSDNEFLGRATIQVKEDTQVLTTLVVGWQEVDADE